MNDHAPLGSEPSPNAFRLLFLGDIVGEIGRKAVISAVPELKEELALDMVVVNGENSAGGKGITGKIAIDLMRAGVAVITTGDHVWDQRDIAEYIITEPRLLRPLNWPEGTPGAGYVILSTKKGKIAVVNAQGRTFIQPALENPFTLLPPLIEEIRKETAVIFVDFHAEATSEKVAMGWHLDGKVSGVCGTHTHVQTADERILPQGTAYLTDAGMCGPQNSVIGSQVGMVVNRFSNLMPARFQIADGPVLLCGMLIDIDCQTGLAIRVERFQRIY